MKRRDFLYVLGAAAATPVAAQAQQAARIRRIGFLGNSNATLEANLIEPFHNELRVLGYEEGRDIHIEYRWADGDYSRFPSLVAELLATNVEVIVTAGTPATLAVKRATSTVPLVMVAVGDPIAVGIVQSLARPGGNITGLSSIAPELEGKRLELLREIVPTLSHVAVFWNPTNAFHISSMTQVRVAAEKLQLKLLHLAVSKTEDLDGAFDAILSAKSQALLILADRVYLHNRKRMMDFAVANRLPSILPYRELVEAGGLMSFGPSYEDMHRRAADYVVKILRGAKPNDLPVELPTKFDLRVNVKAAEAIGVKIPEAFLLRADQVIE